MRYVRRDLEEQVRHAAANFPAVLVNGARRTGKTTLVRRTFPGASYVLFEDPDLIGRFRADPNGFLGNLKQPAILDEVQNVPEILTYVRSRIDAAPRRTGQWILTGSHEAPLMAGVSESLAGRAAILTLMPLSFAESRRVTILRGGFPEVLARPAASDLWFASYVQTYLERDVRHAGGIRDLPAFRRFLGLLATRCGTMLNRADIAAGVGISNPTVSSWLGILEMTQQIVLIPPFFENFGKRLVKSPRVYFSDTGLLSHLLRIRTVRELERSPFLGPIFENHVMAEIAKHQMNRARRREIYYFRDRQGLEVDFVIPQGGKRLLLIEVKSGRTPFPRDAEPLLRLRRSIRGYSTSAVLLFRPDKGCPTPLPVHRGVTGISVGSLRDLL